MGKLYFITLNYVPDYTLYSKLSECTLCTLNYYTYHTLHPDVTFAVMFNIILLHVTSTCFLLRWNKFKRLKHPSSKSIKTKANFFYVSFSLLACIPKSIKTKFHEDIMLNLRHKDMLPFPFQTQVSIAKLNPWNTIHKREIGNNNNNNKKLVKFLA